MAAARSRIATALAALGLLAAACVGGDHGAARAAVGQATGPLIGSSLADRAILVTEGLTPGHVREGEIKVTNIGDTAGAFALGSTGLADGALARKLDLVVQDVTPGGAFTTVFYGKLGSLSSVALGNLAQGEAHVYRFSVSLPSDTGDAYQGTSSAVTFVWSAGVPQSAAQTTVPAPAPATGPAANAAAPAKATTAGATATATFTARARQKGSVSGWVSCGSRCRVALGGTVTVATKRLKLRTKVRTLPKPARVQMRVALPLRARRALAGGRPVTVHLRLQATIGTRVVVVRRTVRVTPAHR